MKIMINTFTKENYTCDYYNQSSLMKVINVHNENSLKTIHINIRSFETNKFKLFYYLNTLKCKFDIIFLTETGKVDTEWAESIFDGYKFVNEPPSSKVGGAGMLIHTNIFDKIEELTDEKYCIKMKCTCSGVVLGKAVFSAVFRGLKKIYQLYQNKNGTSGKEKEFYIR